jgi:hypothetical protein
VPILQLGLESKTLSEQDIFDLGLNFIRTQLATIQGAAVPLPYGGKVPPGHGGSDSRPALRQGHLGHRCLQRAERNQNLILPAGDAKIGDIDYQVKVNSSPRILADLNDMPIKVVNGATVYIKDVAQVRDGYAVQTSIVRTNGTRGALMTVMRNGRASTLAVVNNVKAALPANPGRAAARTARPPVVRSIAVRARGHQRRGARSRHRRVSHRPDDPALPGKLAQHHHRLHFHSALHPGSLIVLSLLGQTINVMTLGGMALAVGILVDDATVEIENTHRNMAMKKPLVRAVLDGAQQIAAPAFVSTLSICIVFVPVLLLTGAAKYPVHAAGHGGGLRHAGVLPAVAHPDSQHGALHAEAGGETLRPGAHGEPPAARDHLESALHLQPAI